MKNYPNEISSVTLTGLPDPHLEFMNDMDNCIGVRNIENFLIGALYDSKGVSTGII